MRLMKRGQSFLWIVLLLLPSLVLGRTLTENEPSPDMAGSGIVDGHDVMLFSTHWHDSVEVNSEKGDLDGDGQTNAVDLLRMVWDYGEEITVITEETTLLDDASNAEILAASTEGIVMLFDDDPPADIEVGDIVITSQGGGYLLRVVDVSIAEKMLTLRTEPASLTDVVDSGRVEGRLTAVRPRTKMIEPGSSEGADRKTSPPVLHLDLAGLNLYSGEDLTVVVEAGSVDLAAEVLFGLEIENQNLSTYRTVIDGTLSTHLDFRLTATDEVSVVNEKILGIWTQPIELSIGDVPLAGVLAMGFFATLEVTASTPTILVGGARSHQVFEAGADYDRGTWYETGDENGWRALDSLAWSLEGILDARLSIEPRVQIEFYNTPVSRIDTDASHRFLGWNTLDVNPQGCGATFTAGLGARLGFDLSVLDPSISPYLSEFNLANDLLLNETCYNETSFD